MSLVSASHLKFMINVLAIGDIVGIHTVEYIGSLLWQYRKNNNIDFVIANGENASVGNGLDTDTAKTILKNGVDIITSGNHIWHKRDIRTFLEDSEFIVRPANYPNTSPGKGYTTIDINGYKFLIMNVMGVIYMESLESPFTCISKILENEKGKYDFSILDIHAEATSEKIALAKYFDGKINVIFGTHTHVTTADEQILPGGTGYITDLGMSGPSNSILGIKNECIIQKLITKLPVKFEVADGNIEINGTIFRINIQNKKVDLVKRVKL